MQSPAEFLARWHYAGLFALILIEEAGVPLPVPGDLFIAAMGFLAREGGAAFATTAAVVTAATLLGATALYLFSRHAGRPLVLKVARRFGYDEARGAHMEAWLARRGWLAVVVGRLIPGLRILMTVVAGALRLPQRTFLAGTAVAGLLWATIYFWLGWALGAGYAQVGGAAVKRAWPVAAALVLAAAVVLGLRWRARRRMRAAAPPPADPP